MNTALVRNGLLFAAAAMLLLACGGGSSGSNPPPNPPPTGGITRTGVSVSVGPVTGFGSIIVNGLTYDTSGATFTRDGEAASQDEFSVGEVVVVKGTIDDDNTDAVAESVEFDDNVEGPVTAVPDTTTLIVMGQTVRLTATTSIDDSCPADLGDPAIVAVEVSGSDDADGVIQATRIECKFAADEFEVTGVVSSHDAASMTFRINALEVDYSAAAVDDFPGGVIADGDPVEAKGTDFDASGDPDVLVATRVEYKGNRFAADEGDHLELEGFITRFVSGTDFDVSGIPVTTLTGTVYEGGTAADLGLNLKVEVEGEFDGDGVLNATKVEIKTSTAVRVVGTVDGVSGDVITVLGIAINTNATNTRFEDKSDADVDPFRVSDINAGDYIEARGQELPAGEITAFLVERDDSDNRTELRGFVEAGGLARPALTVLGVAIDTSGAVFRDVDDSVMSADEFWAAVAEGSLVDADGTEVGPQALVTDEVELEQE